MKPSIRLTLELELLREQARALDSRIAIAERDLAEMKSREWLAANNVKREDIVMSSEKFCHVTEFTQHLAATRCDKPWAEWNGVIYRTVDLVSGFLSYQNSPGRLEHVG